MVKKYGRGWNRAQKKIKKRKKERGEGDVNKKKKATMYRLQIGAF